MNIIILEEYKDKDILEEESTCDIFICNNCENTTFQFKLYPDNIQPVIECAKCHNVMSPEDIYDLT